MLALRCSATLLILVAVGCGGPQHNCNVDNDCCNHGPAYLCQDQVCTYNQFVAADPNVLNYRIGACRGGGAGGGGGGGAGGAGGGGGTPPCPTRQAGIRPLAPSQYYCGQAGSIVVNEMSAIDSFWHSGVVPCVYGADQPYVKNNAVSHGGTGYVYFDPQFLQSMDVAGMSYAPSTMILAHEFGHEIQGWASTGNTYSIAKELGADCYSGYFLGWLGCNKRLSNSDIVAVFMTACNGGSVAPWWTPGYHGTCQQREAALQQGINAYQQGVPPLNACTF